MVAPYEIGDPVRSFVRIPGSGSDKAAKSKCCDLSRVSSAAAAVPVRPTLPNATPIRTLSVPAKQEALAPWNGGGRPSPPNQPPRTVAGEDETAVTTNSPARKRPASDSSEDIPPKRECKAKEDQTKPLGAEGTGVPDDANLSLKAISERLAKLEKERDQLREENQQLQTRLRLVSLLCKNPRLICDCSKTHQRKE